MARPPSRRQEQRELAGALRAEGRSWAEVAEVFRERYGVNARAALRLARGWSQAKASQEWSGRWPDDIKVAKNISHWETWPVSGYPPSLGTLDKLAQLYECSVADLLLDLPDYYAHHDPADSTHEEVVAPCETPGRALGLLWDETAGLELDTLAEALVVSARRADVDVSRRQLLFKLSSAFAVAAASPIFGAADPDMQARLQRVLGDPERVDAATLGHAEDILLRCRHQGDVLGPQAALQTVLAQRELMAGVLPETPDRLRGRALSIHAELSQLAGWLLFNLGDHRSAQHYYDEARSTAHDASNVELVTYVLCTMSHLATWGGRRRVGIDHAVAARAWASQTANPRAVAYAADVAARAYADDGQAERCHEALEAEHTALTAEGDAGASGSWWYFLDESFFWGTSADCALRLGALDDAHDAIARSLAMIDPAHVHNYAFTLLLRGDAFIQEGEVEAASQVIGDAVGLTGASTSTRFVERTGELRRALAPWEDTATVRALDEQLRVIHS